MNKQFEVVFNRLDEPTIALFLEIDALVHQSVSVEVKEKLWQNSMLYHLSNDPDFKPFANHVHNKAVHILPFKGHVNIYADAVANYYDQLGGYKITPRAGMLQIFCGQEIPRITLLAIFKESLT